MKNSIQFSEKALLSGTFIRRGFRLAGFLSGGDFVRGAFIRGIFVRGAFVRGAFIRVPIHSRILNLLLSPCRQAMNGVCAIFS